MQETITLSIIAISFFSMLCQFLSWWLRIPSILFLLVTGLIMGPLTGFLNPSELLGELLYPMISISVAIILFEGSLTLKFKKIRQQKSYIIRFISLGGIITFLSIAFAAYYILDINYSLAFLIGAILTVTGPTVIAPMLKVIRPSHGVCEASKWEGIVLDPFGAILTVLVFEIIATGSDGYILTTSLKSFVLMTSTGTLIGLIFGLLFSELLLRHLIPKFLINIAVLNFVLIAFYISNIFSHETGLLAVTIMGITLANRSELDLTDIIEFKETLSILLISALFIILAARINLQTLYPLITPSLVLFAVMQLVIRPIKVFVTTFKSDLSVPDKTMLIWIAPRGIVAVAIASLFELKLNNIGYTGTEILTPLIFLIIVWSVTLPSLTGKYIAKYLQANQPDPNGVLIIGANPLSISISKELIKNDISVLLIDSNWYGISQARMQGIKTYYSNLVTLDVEYDIEAQQLGKMLSITPNSELSALARMHFKREIEKKDIYQLKTECDTSSTIQKNGKTQQQAKNLFGENITYEKLITMLGEGFEVKSSQLTEQFTFDDYLVLLEDGIVLFAIDKQHNAIPYSSDTTMKPETGWTLISVISK